MIAHATLTYDETELSVTLSQKKVMDVHFCGSITLLLVGYQSFFMYFVGFHGVALFSTINAICSL